MFSDEFMNDNKVKRVFYVDIGKMSKKEAEKYLNNVLVEMGKKPIKNYFLLEFIAISLIALSYFLFQLIIILK